MKEGKGDGEIAQPGKSLPHKHESLNLILRIDDINGTRYMLVIPAMGKLSQRDPWDSLASQNPGTVGNPVW